MRRTVQDGRCRGEVKGQCKKAAECHVVKKVQNVVTRHFSKRKPAISRGAPLAPPGLGK